jgi:tyrosyl-tRNA synthetase
MDAKKRLARTITAGFHGEAAAMSADENWGRIHQQNDLSAITEEIRLDWERLVVADAVSLIKLRSRPKELSHISIAKLLVALGICESRTQGERQADAGVAIDGVRIVARNLAVPSRPHRFTVKVGKAHKAVIIE